MADQQVTGNVEPEHHDHFDIKIGRFEVKLTGQAATMIATTGSVAIAGYCVYKVLNNEKLFESVIAHAFRTGSVVIDFIAENEKATKKALQVFSSNEILETFNEALKEYSKEQNQQIGTFDEVELVSSSKSKIKAIELSKLKEKAHELMKKFQNELNMTFERTINKKKMTTTTTTTTVEEEQVKEKFTLSGKSSSSSAQQQESVKEERTKVGAIEPESVASEDSEQAPTEANRTKQTSSISAEPEKTLKGSAPQTTGQGNTVRKERGEKRKSARSDAEDEENPFRKYPKFNIHMENTKGVSYGDHTVMHFKD